MKHGSRNSKLNSKSSNRAGSPPLGCWKSEDDARTRSHLFQLPFEVVCAIGGARRPEIKIDRDDAIDELTRLSKHLANHPDDRDRIEDLVLATGMLPVDLKGVKTAAGGRANVTADSDSVRFPPALKSALEVELKVTIEDLIFPAMLRGQQREQVRDAVKAHHSRIEACRAKFIEASTSSSCTDAAEVAIRETRLFELKALVVLYATFCAHLDRLCDATEHGHRVVARECRRLRNALPALLAREQFCSALETSRTLVVVGDTGSGKSTQLAQYAADWLYLRGRRRSLVLCTQPRRLAALALTERVRQEWGIENEVGHCVGAGGHQQELHSKSDRIVFFTEFAFLRNLSSTNPEEIAIIIVDEAHERSVQGDIVIGQLYGLLRDSPAWAHVRLIVTSATIDTELFSARLADPTTGAHAPVLSIPGRTFPVQVEYDDESESIDIDSDVVPGAIAAALRILRNMLGGTEADRVYPKGDVLCFLPSAEDVADMVEKLAPALVTLSSELNQEDVTLQLQAVELSGRMDPQEQRKVLRAPPPDTFRVVCCTAVAETSVTIPSVTIVIDTGLVRRMCYNQKRKISEMIVTPVSRNSANQRKGRAGRTQPGVCVRLYSSAAYEGLSTSHRCALLESPLDSACLSLLDLRADPFTFYWLESPPQQAVVDAMSTLCRLQAVVRKQQEPDAPLELTSVGRCALRARIDPRLAFVVDRSRCATGALVVAVATVASMLWIRPQGQEAKVAEARQRLAEICQAGAIGDLGAGAWVLCQHILSPSQGIGKQHFASGSALFKADEAYKRVRSQFESSSQALGPLPLTADVLAREFVAKVKPHLIEAFRDQLAVRVSRFGHYKSAEVTFETADTDDPKIHGSSVVVAVSRAAPRTAKQGRRPQNVDPDVVLFVDAVQTSRNFIKGIVPVDVTEIADSILREKCQAMLDARWEECTIAVSSVLARSWSGRNIKEMLFEPQEIVSIFCDTRDDAGPTVLVKGPKKNMSRIRTVISKFLDATHSVLRESAMEVSVQGALRVMLHAGGVVTRPDSLLISPDMFTAVGIRDSGLSIAAIFRCKPSPILVEVQRQADPSKPTLYAKYASCADAAAAFALLQPQVSQIRGARIFAAKRVSSFAPTQPVIKAKVSIKLNLVDDDLDDLPNIKPMTPDEVEPLFQGLNDVLRLATAHAHVTYDADAGNLTANANTTPQFAADLSAGLRNALDVVEGFSKVRCFSDFVVEIPCMPDIAELVHFHFRSSGPDISARQVFTRRVQAGIAVTGKTVAEVKKVADDLWRRTTGRNVSVAGFDFAQALLCTGHAKQHILRIPDDTLLEGYVRAPATVDDATGVVTYHGRDADFEHFKNHVCNFLSDWQKRRVEVRQFVWRSNVSANRRRDALKKWHRTLPHDIATDIDSAPFAATTITIVATAAALDSLAKNADLFQKDDEGDDAEPNDDDEACPICTMPCQRAHRLLRCGHVLCNDCLASYVNSACLTPRLPILCPLSTTGRCREEMSMHDVRLVSRTAPGRIAHAAVGALAESNSWEFVKCPNPRCSGVLRAPHSTCGACNGMYCVSCVVKFPHATPAQLAPHPGECVEPSACDRLVEQITELMTVRCPVCRMCILDFDGCFAVVCSCTAGFCGFCMYSGGKGWDAHQHVLSCSKNPSRSYYDSIDRWHELRDKDKKARIEKFLENVPAGLHERLKAVANENFNSHSVRFENVRSLSALKQQTPAAKDAAPTTPSGVDDSLTRGSMPTGNAETLPKDVAARLRRLGALLMDLEKVARFGIMRPPPQESLQIACERAAVLIPNVWDVYSSCRWVGGCKDLTHDEATAIRMYTANGLYRRLNEVLRSCQKRGKDYDALALLMHYLLSGLSKLPKIPKVTVYRGLTLSKVESTKYRIGRCVSWRAFSSTSTTGSVAGNFGTTVSLTLHLRGSGVSVAPLSCFPSEDEVLLPPRVPLQIKKRTESGGVIVLELEEIV